MRRAKINPLIVLLVLAAVGFVSLLAITAGVAGARYLGLGKRTPPAEPIAAVAEEIPRTPQGDFRAEMQRLAESLASRGFKYHITPTADDDLIGPWDSPAFRWLPCRFDSMGGFLIAEDLSRCYNRDVMERLEVEWAGAREHFPEPMHKKLSLMLYATELALTDRFSEDWREDYERNGITCKPNLKTFEFDPNYRRLDVSTTAAVDGWNLEIDAMDVSDVSDAGEWCRIIVSYEKNVP